MGSNIAILGQEEADVLLASESTEAAATAGGGPQISL